MSRGGYRGGSTVLNAGSIARQKQNNDPVSIENIRAIEAARLAAVAEKRSKIKEAEASAIIVTDAILNEMSEDEREYWSNR